MVPSSGSSSATTTAPRQRPSSVFAIRQQTPESLAREQNAQRYVVHFTAGIMDDQRLDLPGSDHRAPMSRRESAALCSDS